MRQSPVNSGSKDTLAENPCDIGCTMLRNRSEQSTVAPDILSPQRVEAMLGIDSTTIWRLRRRGLFPQPLQLSPRRVGYRRVDIERWLEQRQAASIAKVSA